MQVKNYPNALKCAQAVMREEGIQGFFRGVTIPLITITFVRTVSFSMYSTTRKWMERKFGSREDHLARTALYGMIGGIASGTVISCFSAPFELVKVERQLEYLIATQRHQMSGSTGPLVFQPRSGSQAARDIFRTHGGMRGFYLGLRLHMLRDMSGTACYFGLYDSIRLIGDRMERNNMFMGTPAPVVSFLIGSMSGILSWFFIYPIDLIKTQVQRDALAGAQRQSAMKVFKRLLQRGDAKETDFNLRRVPLSRFLQLYRGLGISAVRSFISHGLMWTTIEAITQRVESEARNHELDSSYDFLDFQ